MRRIVAVLSLMMLFSTGFAQSYEKTGLGVSAKVNSMDIEIQFYGSSIVRVVKSPEGEDVQKESLSVIKTPENVKFTTKQAGEELVLKSKSVEVVLNLQNGKVSFRNSKGKTLLTEKEGG